MAGGMAALQNTVLNKDSHLSKVLLFIPQPNLLRTNPEQANNVVVNSKYLKILELPNTPLPDLERYRQYLNNNLD